MTIPEIKALLQSTGLPCAYYRFKSKVNLPYICFFESGSRNFAADGVVYHPVRRLQVELYTEEKDPETEARVEQALASFFWEKSETYIEKTEVYQILYECEV